MTKENPHKLTKRSLPPEVRLSVKAGQDKKAEDIVVLDLRDISTLHRLLRHHDREFHPSEHGHL